MQVVPYSPDTVAALAKDHDLLTTEADLMAVAEDTGDKDSPLWKHVEHFQVTHCDNVYVRDFSSSVFRYNTVV